MKNIKYIIFDMGKVLLGPSTGDWIITPTLLKYIKKDDINIINNVKKEIKDIIHRKAVTIEEEYALFLEYYSKLNKMANLNLTEDEINEIVYDFVYDKKDDKYYLYDDVKDVIKDLYKDYTLLIISDNWPCAIEYLKTKDLYKFFKKVYISSIYGIRKKEKGLFDFPIKDFNIKENEALFIDDRIELLDIAKEKGFNVLLMDRDNLITESRYQVIHNLSEIKEIIY